MGADMELQTSTDLKGRRIVVTGGAGALGGAVVSLAGGSIAYSVSKAGVTALTQALADEVKGSHVLVNAVLPSIIDTAANRAVMPNPAGVYDRWPKPAAIAAAIAWLASPAN